MMNCRSCGLEVTEPILDLGLQPLANRYPETAEGVEMVLPLRLCVCRHCWMVQLTDTVDAETLFRDYPYFTSCSAPMVEHARRNAERYMERFNLRGHTEPGFEKWVVEVASNDGYFLRHFMAAGVPCYGIEPAENVGRVAQERGIESHPLFFNCETAFGRGPLYDRKATLLLANNVLAHCQDINDFVAAVRGALAPYGHAILEFPYAVDLFERGEFDTIYHEHVFYLTLTSLAPLFDRNGLAIYHVEQTSVHGGALRIFVARRGFQTVQPSVVLMQAEEKRKGVDTLEFYTALKTKAARTSIQLNRLLFDLVREGKSIAAYGASAKSTVLLNYAGITRETVKFICDTTPAKQGRFAPGTHIPIIATEELLMRMPDYCVLLIWNFTDHVLKHEAEYTARGGRFITPFPEPKVLA